RERGDYRFISLFVQRESLVPVAETCRPQPRRVGRRARGLVVDSLDLEAAESPFFVGFDQRVGPVAVVGLDPEGQERAAAALHVDDALAVDEDDLGAGGASEPAAP